jgi:hypothetical protein
MIISATAPPPRISNRSWKRGVSLSMAAAAKMTAAQITAAQMTERCDFIIVDLP